jgi:tetratricopeptide (TPR) repeat protein
VKIHPGDLLLEEMLLLPPGEMGRLLRHLAGCSHCRSRLDGLPANLSLPAGRIRPRHALAVTDFTSRPFCKLSRAEGSVDYGPAIEKSERKYLAQARALRQERAEAPGLLAEVLARQPEQRRLLLANSARFQSWGLYELLLDRSWEVRGADRAEAEELALLSIHLAPHLDASYYQRELIEDLQARAWSYVANLRRIASDMAGADEAFEIAYAHLQRGTREPLERAVFLDLKASLRGAQRRLDEAKKLLRRAVAIFLHQGDEHRAGKSLINLSFVHSNARETEEAIAVLQRSLLLIDPAQDERLLLCAWHNLIDYLTDLGRFIEAQGLYRKARPLYRKFSDDLEFGKKRLWAKGRIARGLGQSQEAEALLIEARERYLAEEIPYYAALVSLELATLYSEQKRTRELKQLATEMLPIFASRHIHREALAALMFLKQAVDAERLSAEVVTRVADFLRRAEGDPGLRFEAPG